MWRLTNRGQQRIYISATLYFVVVLMGRKAKSRKRTTEEKLTDSEEEQMIRTIEHLATFCRLAKDHGEQMSATVLAVFSSDDPDKAEKVMGQ